jgi:tetraacyldisaccharide 4'-kinase
VAALHGGLVMLRWFAYSRKWLKTTRFPVPVVVVGNVIAGGAGKTPLVIMLVRYFQARGLQVGVVSRGYGRASDACMEIHRTTPISLSGDEPALIKRSTGAAVFVARQRVDAVRHLLHTYPETKLVICDDGLQHYALHRDVEIAVFDDRGVGNGWLLPAGPLREPWPWRQHRGIDLVLHTGATPAFEGFTSIRQLAPYALSSGGRKTQLAALQGQRLIALAGIANPSAFFSMLRQQGLQLQQTIALPDHYDFDAWSDNFFATNCLNHTVLCTEKDAVKLFSKEIPSTQVVLAVPLEFTPDKAFLEALDAKVSPLLNQMISQVPCLNGL